MIAISRLILRAKAVCLIHESRGLSAAFDEWRLASFLIALILIAALAGVMSRKPIKIRSAKDLNPSFTCYMLRVQKSCLQSYVTWWSQEKCAFRWKLNFFVKREERKRGNGNTRYFEVHLYVNMEINETIERIFYSFLRGLNELTREVSLWNIPERH